MNKQERNKVFEIFIKNIGNPKKAIIDKELEADSKVYLDGWPEIKEAPKYITVEDFIDTKTIDHIVLHDSLIEYTRSGRCTFVLTSKLEDIAKMLVTKAFHQSSKNSRECYMSCTVTEVKQSLCESVKYSAFIQYLIDYEFITFDGSLLRASIQSVIDKEKIDCTEDNTLNRVMLKSDFEQLQEIKHRLLDMQIAGKVKLYTGIAGTGKSYLALEEAHSCCGNNLTAVALSNTVILHLYDSYRHRFDEELVVQSIASIRYSKELTTDNFIIDEFSQWGLSELGVFLKILNRTMACYGNLYIMGDLHQIKSFLGRGSLLYAVQQMLASNTACYRHIPDTDMRRTEDNTLKKCILEYLSTHKIKSLNRYFTHHLDTITADDHIYVTGTNDSVDCLNERCIRQLCAENGVHYYDRDMLQTLVTLVRQQPVRLLCRTTKQYCDPTKIYNKKVKELSAAEIFSCKQLTNDRALLCYHTDFEFEVKFNRAGMQPLYINCYDLLKYFALGYAITVNKAQGLEWDNVTVVNTNRCMNLRQYEAFFVACTRARRHLEIYDETALGKFGHIYNTDEIMPGLIFKNHFNIQVN